MAAADAGGGRALSPDRRRWLAKRSVLEEEEAAELTKQSASLTKLRELKEKMLKEMQDQEKQKAHSAEGQVAPLSLAGEYKGGKDRELARWRPRPTSAERQGPEDLLSKYKEKLKDIMRTSAGQMVRKEFEAIEKERRELEIENQRLRDVINLRHECSLRREERCQREIQDLKQRLDGIALSGLDPDLVMSRLRAVNGDIQAEVQQLKGIIESQAEVEKMNLVRAYRVKMHEVKKQLADEKELNYTGAQEWIEKHKLLQHDLDAATAELNQIKEKNRLLVAENRNLKVAYRNQEQERTTTVKSIAVLKRENERLEEQITKLEFQILQVAKKRGGDDGVLLLQAAATAVHDAGGMTAEKRQRYMQSIDKMKAILEQDRKALKQARSEHMTMLAERTELEIFLRQCIDDVRREIGRHSRMMATRPVSQLSTREGDFSLDQYTANDRKRIMDILLSKERVLLLLYDKTFPYKKDSLERDRDSEPVDPATLGLATESTAPTNVNELWDKWKSWTTMSTTPAS